MIDRYSSLEARPAEAELRLRDHARRLMPDAIDWIKRSSYRMDEVGVRLYAGAIAYRTIFSLVAFLSTFAIIAVVAGIEPGDLRDDPSLLDDIPIFAEDLEELSKERVARTMELGNVSAFTAGIIGLLVGLYTLSGSFAALCDVLDRVHGVHAYRRLTRRMLRGAWMAVLFLLLAAVTLTLMLLTTEFGAAVFGGLGLNRISTAWVYLFRVVLPICAVTVTIGFVLRYGSHARPPWGQVIPCTLVATASWLLLLAGFTSYLLIFDGFETYGALANAAALLLFGYLQAYLIILVAMFRFEIATIISLLPLIRRSGDGSSVSVHMPGGSHDA